MPKIDFPQNIPKMVPAHRLATIDDSFLNDDYEEEIEENNKMECYLCENIYNEDYIGYTCFEDKTFALCFDCFGDSYLNCDSCNKDIQEYEELKLLCDIYDDIDTCILCRVKDHKYNNSNHEINKLKKEIITLNVVIDELRCNKTYLKNKINELEEKDKNQINLINQLNEDLEKNKSCKCNEKEVNSLEVGDTDKYVFKDNYIDYILKEDIEVFKKRIKDNFENNLRKNTLKSKIMSILKEDKSSFIELKNKMDNKIKLFKENIKKNTMKSKVVSCLRDLSDNKNNLDKIIEMIKKYKNILKFDDEELNNCALENNRSKINFFSKLYEKKVIDKTLSNKDFTLAYQEYHNDKNSTRMTNISRICYYLRKNNVIFNSKIIFKSLYIFQYINEYQILYLINKIEKII
jgi:hypothetical protein